jgi:hypothetical protein
MDRYCSALILVFLFFSSAFAQEVTRKTADGTKTDVTKWDAYSKIGSSYNAISKQLDFDVNVHTGKGWLLIHDGVAVKNIICVDGKTSTIWNMLTCTSKQDCFNQADVLKLTYNKDDYEYEKDCAVGVGAQSEPFLRK